MDNLFKELNDIETEQSELNRLQALKQAVTDAQQQHKEHLNQSFGHVTDTFKEKLKENNTFSKMVEDYVQKYVPSEKHTDAREDLFNILAKEMISTFNSLNHTSCGIM